MSCVKFNKWFLRKLQGAILEAKQSQWVPSSYSGKRCVLPGTDSCSCIWFSSPMAASALLAHLSRCRLWKEMRYRSFPPLSLHPFKRSQLPGWQFLGRCPRTPRMETNFLASGIWWRIWCGSLLSPDQMCCVYHTEAHTCVYLTAGDSVWVCTDFGVYLSPGLVWIR